MARSGRYRVTEDGLVLPLAGRMLRRPEDFRPGPGGQYLDDLARECAQKLVEPLWYVLPTGAGGPISGSRVQGDRVFLARIGFSPQDHTELFVYGRMKPGARAELDHEVIPPGRPTEYGAQVWSWHLHSAQGEWDVDVYHDEPGFYWVIRQDPMHAAAGLERRYDTRLRVLAAAIEHLREDGITDLLPILVDG